MIGIYLDLQKAFDTVDHSILLWKLNNYGIKEVMHSWFKCYLSNSMYLRIVATLLNYQFPVGFPRDLF